MSGFYGRFRVAFTSLAAFAVVCLGLGLGSWQLRRADEKAALQLAQDRAATEPALSLSTMDVNAALPAPAAVEGKRVQANGAFLAARTIFLDNRTREGVAGFHVLTPLKFTGRGEYVMVLRGWIARDPIDRNRLPPVETPADPVEVVGLAVTDLPQPMKLAEEPAPGSTDRLWQHFDYGKFETWAGIRLYPTILRQTVEPGYRDGLARDWNQPGASVDRHRGYAFQWFAMTAVALVTWLFLLWRFRASHDNDVDKEGAGQVASR